MMHEYRFLERRMSALPARIACLAQKGGGGKTTLATNLAAAAAGAGISTLLLDLDAQQSSARAWAAWRAAARPETPAPLAIRATSWDNLEAALADAARAKRGLVVLDTPGQKGAVSNFAASVSNIVLVAVQPSMLDLATIAETLALSNVTNRPAFVVFNRVPDRAALAEAREIVAARGHQSAPAFLSNLAAYRDAAGEGRGVLEYELAPGAAKAALADLARARKEVSELHQWAMGQLRAHPLVGGRQIAEPWGEARGGAKGGGK
jgi:chromosome partitioning protein